MDLQKSAEITHTIQVTHIFEWLNKISQVLSLVSRVLLPWKGEEKARVQIEPTV
jgi:hypothetical protein